MYNVTCITTVANAGGVATCTNTATGGVLFTMLSVALFFIMLFALRRGQWEVDSSILSASFACFVLTMILAFGKYVHPIVPLAYLALLGFTGLYMKLGRNA